MLRVSSRLQLSLVEQTEHQETNHPAGREFPSGGVGGCDGTVDHATQPAFQADQLFAKRETNELGLVACSLCSQEPSTAESSVVTFASVPTTLVGVGVTGVVGMVRREEQPAAGPRRWRPHAFPPARCWSRRSPARR